jgi:hypothetical protein
VPPAAQPTASEKGDWNGGRHSECPRVGRLRFISTDANSSCSPAAPTRRYRYCFPAGQKQHVRSGQGPLAVAPGNFLDEDRLAAAAIDASHGVEQKNRKPPERNEFESPLGKFVVTAGADHVMVFTRQSQIQNPRRIRQVLSLALVSRPYDPSSNVAGSIKS